MRYRASFLTGLAAGYVLGARAGHERYEQIKRVTRSVVNNPQVQHAADTVGTQAGNLVGSAARVAADKGRVVTEKVGDKLPARVADKLPAGLRHHNGDGWQPSGQNGYPATGATGGTTGTGGPV